MRLPLRAPTPPAQSCPPAGPLRLDVACARARARWPPAEPHSLPFLALGRSVPVERRLASVAVAHEGMNGTTDRIEAHLLIRQRGRGTLAVGQGGRRRGEWALGLCGAIASKPDVAGRRGRPDQVSAVPLISQRRGWHAFGLTRLGDWGRRAGGIWHAARREPTTLTDEGEGCRRRDPKTEAVGGARARACALRIGCPQSKARHHGALLLRWLVFWHAGDVQIPRVRRSGD